MIRTWITDISPLMDNDTFTFYYEGVPKFRQKKALNFKNQEDRARSIGAWTLLSEIRSRHNICEAATYNLSHSGNYALCSISDTDDYDVMVGCDIEHIKEFHQRIAERFFCDSEYKDIMSENTLEKRTDKFYRYWVMKESFMKATRRGMGLDMKKFEIDLSGEPRLIKQPSDILEEYYYKEYVLKDIPYKVAVCSTINSFVGELETDIQL